MRARLELAGVDSRAETLVADDPRRGLRLISAPPIQRTSMAPEPWRLGAIFPFCCAGASARCGPADDPLRDRSAAAGSAPATMRRIALLALVVAQTIFATDYMAAVLPYHGRQPLEVGILALFAILFLWVSAGFWTAMAGFVAAAPRQRSLLDLGARRARHAAIARRMRAPRS